MIPRPERAILRALWTGAIVRRNDLIGPRFMFRNDQLLRSRALFPEAKRPIPTFFFRNGAREIFQATIDAALR